MRKPKSPERNRILARAMRKSMTDAEKRLWWALRRRLALTDTHFRRQVTIGPYIADFCCHAAKLILEADGGQHYTDEGAQRDLQRTRYLQAQGFSVLRFSNSTIFDDMDSVLETVQAHMPAKTHGN